ncbi:hypothetical protein JTB14_037075 [Gonioctena quinquepunctata]|nr:hypothetical protein JTB14_037075 [Gonioctena quinquepunctata]
MANESNISLPFNDNSNSSDDWSSSDEKQTPLKRLPVTKISKDKIFKEKKFEVVARLTKISKKRKRVVSVCLTHCRYDVIRRVAQKFGYKEVTEGENWNMYWTDLSITVDRCKEMKRFQKINHFPGMLEICRKDLLARNLNRMLRLFPRDYNFFPKSWCFPADLGEALTYSRLRKNKTFILKPEAGSQGRGIFISLKPYLIDGYKFDLRVYTLITSCDPLRIFIYNEGLVRFATSRYKEPNGINITNVFMHLTNYAVNKHSRTYNQDTEGGSKRKLSWFNNYLRSLKHDVEAIWYRIDDVIIKTIISAYPVLKHSYAACFPNHDIIPACCELLGIDILLDKRLNPQVLEVNHSPSFHTDSELDCEVKEALLHDMFAMMNLENCDKRKIMREDRKRSIIDTFEVRSEYNSSFEAQVIVDYEEKERLQRLAQRDYLVRSQGLLELIYFSMKKNNVLRPHDERKYAIFDKIRHASEVISKSMSNGPGISDMLEEINGKAIGETISAMKREIYPWHKEKLQKHID